jgi:hypothetical protein
VLNVAVVAVFVWIVGVVPASVKVPPVSTYPLDWKVRRLAMMPGVKVTVPGVPVKMA